MSTKIDTKFSNQIALQAIEVAAKAAADAAYAKYIAFNNICSGSTKATMCLTSLAFDLDRAAIEADVSAKKAIEVAKQNRRLAKTSS